ncbi:hypothetical protein E4U41_001353 [Claviceps citrina]|nr:hypothetical protein E4U41_001353 [Claviceps citrina]
MSGHGLYLFSAPPSYVGVAHVARGLDGWDEFECDVTKTSDANNGTSNVAQNLVTKEETADENVD